MGVAERRQRERAARRELIVDAARQVLLRQGIRGTTTKEIAQRCELSEATLFFYFRSKDEILLSLILESISAWAEGLEALLAQALPPADLLRAIWEFHEQVYRDHPDYYVISAYLAEPVVLENVSDEVKQEIAQRSGENFRRLRKLLDRVDPTTPGDVLANLIWALFLGLTLRDASRANLGYHRPGGGIEARARVFDVINRGFGFAPIAEAAPVTGAAVTPLKRVAGKKLKRSNAS